MRCVSSIIVKVTSFKSNLIPNSPRWIVNVLAELANSYLGAHEFVIIDKLIEVVAVTVVLAAVLQLEIVNQFDSVQYLQNQVAVHHRDGLMVGEFTANKEAISVELD